MSDAQIKHMVDRFLSWRLPENFAPDNGISFKPTFNDHMTPPMRRDPSGTNLFDAEQAEAMVRYMIEGSPQVPLENGRDEIGDSFWVLEMSSEPEGGPPRYWSGLEKGWAYRIDDAIRYIGRADVERAMARRHLGGQPVEHSYVGRLTLSDVMRRAYEFVCANRKPGDHYGATDDLLSEISRIRSRLATAGGGQ